MTNELVVDEGGAPTVYYPSAFSAPDIRWFFWNVFDSDYPDGLALAVSMAERFYDEQRNLRLRPNRADQLDAMKQAIDIAIAAQQAPTGSHARDMAWFRFRQHYKQCWQGVRWQILSAIGMRFLSVKVDIVPDDQAVREIVMQLEARLAMMRDGTGVERAVTIQNTENKPAVLEAPIVAMFWHFVAENMNEDLPVADINADGDIFDVGPDGDPKLVPHLGDRDALARFFRGIGTENSQICGLVAIAMKYGLYMGAGAPDDYRLRARDWLRKVLQGKGKRQTDKDA